MLAIGASIGGLVTAVAGRNVAFVVNAVSFFASAFFIAQTRYDVDAAGGAAAARLSGAHRHRRSDRRRSRTCGSDSHVAALMFVKAGWGLAGGVLLLLTIFGQRVFPLGGGTAAGIGVLYGARGIGAGLGPIALRWMLGQEPRRAAAGDRARRSSWSACSTSRWLSRRRCGSPRSACSAPISADRFCGCSARCCCRWRCPTAFAAASSPPSSRW